MGGKKRYEIGSPGLGQRVKGAPSSRAPLLSLFYYPRILVFKDKMPMRQLLTSRHRVQHQDIKGEEGQEERNIS